MNPRGAGTRSTECLTPPLAGIVVAGGKGTRLGGRDKAFLEIDGEPIIARTLRLFRAIFTQTIIVTRHPERFAAFGAEVTVDRYPGKGPLAGIHAGLLACRTSHAFVAACDMPLLDPDVIRYLVDRLPRTGGTPDVPDGPDAIVPWWDGDVEPLHAIYAARTLPTMERCLERDEHAVRTFLERVRVDYVAETELVRLSGAPRSFTNVNTPEELQHVLERLQADAPAHNGARQ